MSMRWIIWALEQKIGSHCGKLILIKLADNANDDGVCWPSIPYVAKHTEMTVRTVQTQIAILADRGFIEVIRRPVDGAKNGTNVYRLSPPKGGEKAAPTPPQQLHRGGETISKGGETGAPRVGAGDAPEPKTSFEPKKEPVIEPPAPKGAGKRPTASSKPRTQIGDYTPSEGAQGKAVAHWEKRGRMDLVEKLEDEVFRFMSFHTGKGSRMVDWEAAWQTWYCNALSMNKPPNGSGPYGAGAQAFEQCSVDDWKGRLKIYYGYHADDAEDAVAKGTWPKTWGPRPEAPGCKVPREAFQAVKPKVGRAAP